MIPQSFILELLSVADIVDTVGRHVQLKKAGSNFQGLCPFHEESRPSFTVSPTKQFYHCFGCGAHGNSLRFLMNHLDMGFTEAVASLAATHGLEIPRAPEADRRSKAPETSFDLDKYLLEMASTVQIGIQNLEGCIDGAGLIKGMQIAPSTVKRYALGYLNTDRESAVASEAPGQVIEEFRGRLVMPVRTAAGQPVGMVGARLIRAVPDYVVSQSSHLFSIGYDLYGVYEAKPFIREQNRVIVVNAALDVLMLAERGHSNSVSTFGDAPTPVQVRKIFRLSDNVVFLFSGDAEGKRKARRTLYTCLSQITDAKLIKFGFLSGEGADFGSLAGFTPESLDLAINNAVPLSRFLISQILGDGGLENEISKQQGLRRAKNLLQVMPSNALRLQILHLLAKLFGMTTAELERFLLLKKPVCTELQDCIVD